MGPCSQLILGEKASNCKVYPLAPTEQMELCHGPCLVTFFPKNNQRTTPTESPMMAASSLFSATITTGHLCRTYIGAPLEYSLHSITTKTTCILIIVITHQHHVLSTAAQPQPHHAPHMFHVPGQSHRACTSLEVMSLGHHKDLRGFTSASFGTIRNTSLLVICSFYYHMLFTITPYMFMFCFSINTPVCCMYFASLNINLATYFSLTRSRLLKLLFGSTPDSPTLSGTPKFEASSKRAAQPTSWSQRLARLWTRRLRPNSKLNKLDQFPKENLEMGQIHPSKFPMASLVFFIKKKDGTLWLVQDYQVLNMMTVKNKYPLPLISKLINKLRGAKYFTKLDVRWGFNNVRMKEGDEWKAAF